MSEALGDPHSDALARPPATPRAHGEPVGEAVLRAEPADFQVDEIMVVEPEGEGEHLWLEIEKTDWNTEDVALWLARNAGLHRLSVGYSGLKDRRAVTRQWFSLHLPGKPDPEFQWPPGLRSLRAARHRRKLNRGTHRGNTFRLRLRELAADQDALAARLERIAAEGVPNYFGEQRFGRDGANWTRGRAWLLGGEAPRKRPLRNFWLSGVRSGLFNAVLAERVRRDVWHRLLDGDLLQPDGSRGLFSADDDHDAAARVAAGTVHPTAPLPGRMGMASSGACRQLEDTVLADHVALVEALADLGLDAERRATRLPVSALQWQCVGDTLELTFRLPTGAFATAVLAELLTTRVPSANRG
ncbi:tRNA pseudouridine(13) synthase TruD [Alloalcanivorax sp. C16-2]|uniref:tRNA pseudouridine(13) synthase TruD n=1 Tax=Alloalcanivorax sp. C16-2 TaxID=3390052 RepID=UPI0039706ED3